MDIREITGCVLLLCDYIYDSHPCRTMSWWITDSFGQIDGHNALNYGDYLDVHDLYEKY